MDSRILGIIGGVLLIIGTFCPLVYVEFLDQSVTYFSPRASWEGIVMILLGIVAIALAVLRKYKLLLIPGILSLAIAAYDYFSFKSQLSAAVGRVDESVREQAENAISMKWGWIVFILGGLILLAAGALGKNAPAPGAAWGATPPPPPPYTPGR